MYVKCNKYLDIFEMAQKQYRPFLYETAMIYYHLQ